MTKNSLAEYETFFRQVKWLIIVLVALIVVPLCIYLFFVSQSLDSIRESLHYQPPEERSDRLVDDDLEAELSNPAYGQIVYVPAYSHIYHQDGKPHLLTITLSVRNISLDREIVVKSVRYFDTQGKEIKSYLKKPLRLGALATTEFLIERDDTSGGSGANFLVEWVASHTVPEPIIEAVMIDTSGQQGIAFVRQGTVIREVAPRPENLETNQEPTTSQ